MARKRGLFAELQHLNQQAAKQRRQQEAAAFRARFCYRFPPAAMVGSFRRKRS